MKTRCTTIRLLFPYLQREVQHVRALGVIPFMHTGGNVMPAI